MTTDTVMPLHDLLRDVRACSDAVAWATSFSTLDAAWSACERADWMLWLAGRLSGPPESASRKRLVLCACACDAAADGAAYAADAAADDDDAASVAYLKRLSDVVREHYPTPPTDDRRTA